MPRCVNIDWLEVYCLESNSEYPCNAEYFRRHGYIVHERDYGTRQYREMFTLEDRFGKNFVEVRRAPVAPDMAAYGISEFSTHIRLVNRYCYHDEAITMLIEFLARHNYVFKRIYRLDICLDFETFDWGQMPFKFVRSYLQGKIRKINQCNLSAHGVDNWNATEYDYLSWGSRNSMVTTKIYNKTKELAETNNDKPYIKQAWYLCGLVDDVQTLEKIKEDGTRYKPDIWRVEFSLNSKADHWLVIEDTSGKRVKKKAISHELSMFNGRDKLWHRFEELAYHYFRFKYFKADTRKDRCPDCNLFRFNTNREFYKVMQLASDKRKVSEIEILRNRLYKYVSHSINPQVNKACYLIIHELERQDLTRFTPNGLDAETAVYDVMNRINASGKVFIGYDIAATILQDIQQGNIW